MEEYAVIQEFGFLISYTSGLAPIFDTTG